MRHAALTVGLVMSVVAGGQIFAAPVDPNCALSEREAALVRITADQIAVRASTEDFGHAESRVPSAGCGVWSILISVDGAVLSTQRLRSSHRGSFVEVVEPWLRENRYQTSGRQWTGLVLVTMTPKDTE